MGNLELMGLIMIFPVQIFVGKILKKIAKIKFRDDLISFIRTIVLIIWIIKLLKFLISE